MQKLQRKDLLSLEAYASQRSEFRSKVMAHKNDRRLELGPHLLLLFEDRLTIQYQIQEILRAERCFEAEQIQEELDAYNPLIPDGDNWQATMMLQYPDVDMRRSALQALRDIEHCVWLQIAGFEKIMALADEDLDRSSAEKTSAVHFLRFELNPAQKAAVLAGHHITAGVEHEAYHYVVAEIDKTLLAMLRQDLI